jgi:glycerophosphoryl diester phosphodiesterase
MWRSVEIQGHRGARALRPENTLPSFESALDARADSIETDLRATRDSSIVLFHDPTIGGLPVTELMFADLRDHVADVNPDPVRFPRQKATVSPLSAEAAGPRHPYSIPRLEDFFAFVRAYAREPGERHGKSREQREQAARLIFDLEVKQDPTGAPLPDCVLRTILEQIEASGLRERCRVRSFDPRIVRWFSSADPKLETGALWAGGPCPDPVAFVAEVGARFFAPFHGLVDRALVEEIHAAGVRVLPWTANESGDWERLLACGVDGICTDDPAGLAEYLEGTRGRLPSDESDPSPIA